MTTVQIQIPKRNNEPTNTHTSDSQNLTFSPLFNQKKQLWYFDAVLYVTCLGLTKVSILLFYLTVFPKRSFRLVAHLLIAGNAVYVVVFGCLLLFQCRPVSGAWRAWDTDTAFDGGDARCLDLNVIGWSGAVANIVLDVATIALPMPELFALSMSRRKKVQIVGMFALGFL